MDIQIVTVFYLCDKLLEALNHQQDPQTQISDAEVMTTALGAALFFVVTSQRLAISSKPIIIFPICSHRVGSIDDFTEL